MQARCVSRIVRCCLNLFNKKTKELGRTSPSEYTSGSENAPSFEDDSKLFFLFGFLLFGRHIALIVFWLFMMTMDLLTPCVMIAFGKRFLDKPPKSINYIYGYRTNMSTKNLDTWVFAHKHFGRLWYKLGLILVPCSILPLILVWGENANTIGIVGGIVCGVQIIISTIIPMILTEKALKKVYDKNGKRKAV